MPSHTIDIKVKKDEKGFAQVVGGHCSCKSGRGGHCNHVFALIYQLQDYYCMDVVDIPAEVSCTSRPQSWSIPRAKAIRPQPVMGSHFARSMRDKEGRKRKPVLCKLYDARGPKFQKCFSETDFCSTLKTENNPAPYAYLLSDQSASKKVKTVFGELPIGSYLSNQLTDFDKVTLNYKFKGPRTTEVDYNQNCPQFIDIPVLCNRVHIFSSFDDKIKQDFWDKNITIENIMQTIEIEKRTVRQSESREWLSFPSESIR